MNYSVDRGGVGVRQSTAEPTTPGVGLTSVTSQSAKPAPKVLITFAEAAEILGICERKAREVVPTLVTPVVLGERIVRIVRAELEASVSNLPRQSARVEPPQLQCGRVRRQKKGARLQSPAS